MVISAISSTVQSSSYQNPNYAQLLQDLTALRVDNQLLAKYLSQTPPPLDAIQKLLDAMQVLAAKIQGDANGDTAITPAIGSLMAAIDNALALLQNGDLAGISILMENGNFQDNIGNLIYFCTYPATVPPIQPANKGDMAYQLSLLENYLAQYKYDLAHHLYDQADQIYGYVLTAAGDLMNDGLYDPAIAPVLGSLIGTIYAIRACMLNGDYAACAYLLDHGALPQDIEQITKFLLPQYTTRD